MAKKTPDELLDEVLEILRKDDIYPEEAKSVFRNILKLGEVEKSDFVALGLDKFFNIGMIIFDAFKNNGLSKHSVRALSKKIEKPLRGAPGGIDYRFLRNRIDVEADCRWYLEKFVDLAFEESEKSTFHAIDLLNVILNLGFNLICLLAWENKNLEEAKGFVLKDYLDAESN